MKAIHIDAANRTIKQVEYDGDYKSIYKWIGADCFDCVYPSQDRATIFVDDNGLLNSPQYFFAVKMDNGLTYPLAGNGLILGCDEQGESIACPWSLAEAAKRIIFISRLDAMRLADEQNL